MRIDDGGGPSTNQPQNWTNSYTPLSADISSLTDFYQAMIMKLGPQAMSSATGTLAPMIQMIDAGLLGMGGKTDPSAGVFPEGVMVAQLMADTHSKFTAFLKDVTNGIMCMGNAAGTISEIYGSSDAMNSANLNDVMFAFNDPSATRPKDLPASATTQTFSDLQAQQANASGQYAMALTAGDDQATQVITPEAGITIYMFADGSSKQITTTSDSNSWQSGTTTTTTCFFNGNVVGTTTQSQYTYRGGYSSITTTQSPTDDPHAVGSTSTNVMTGPDGTQTITTTTVGKDGPQTGAPVTVKPTQPSTTSTDYGPVQQAEQQYQTSGDKDYVQQHGSGY